MISIILSLAKPALLKNDVVHHKRTVSPTVNSAIIFVIRIND